MKSVVLCIALLFCATTCSARGAVKKLKKNVAKLEDRLADVEIALEDSTICKLPCKNGGQCVDQDGKWECACEEGFTGIHCEAQTGGEDPYPVLGGELEQWVSSVRAFSSEYNPTSWAANQVVGPANVYPQYGDISGTWAQQALDAYQSITVSFAEKVVVTAIDIYETFHAGGVKKITALIPNEEGDLEEHTLYTSGGIQNIADSRIFSPTLENIGMATNIIRIDIDCSVSGSWVEIDAIKLHGNPLTIPYPVLVGELEQWVSSVRDFSSEYNPTSWAANQVVGPANVYPQYGDIAGTWAQLTKDANQYITVNFAEKVVVTALDIYETFHAGGVKKITALIPNEETGNLEEFPLYTSGGVQDITASRIFSPTLQDIGKATNIIRIDIDCSVSGTWVEIDAIKLHGNPLTI